jgi:acetamidase/formamidase
MIVGLDTDLLEAMKLASRNAIDFLVRTQGLTAEESYQFLSMVGDFEIAEAVNVIKNVTVHIPKSVFKGTGKPLSLCSGGTFPLQGPKVKDDAPCVPQVGIIVE